MLVVRPFLELNPVVNKVLMAKELINFSWLSQRLHEELPHDILNKQIAFNKRVWR